MANPVIRKPVKTNLLTTTLNKISGTLFFVGFISARLKNVPIIFVGAIFNLVSLFSFLIGYLAWYVAALLHPEHPRKRDNWSGFTDLKHQYQIAALIGTIATIATLICLLVPILIVPTAWLYTVSNIMWFISECHKKENPIPGDESYSSSRQLLYLRYAFFLTSSSAVTAVAVTTVFLLPATSLIVLSISTIIGLGLTIASIYYWVTCVFGNHPPDNINHSYNKLSKELSFSLESTPKPDNTYIAGPQKEKTHHSIIASTKPVTDNEENLDSACIAACH